MALLLPKLRSHFAEFLNNTSPVGLRILSSSTCVGLRYGHIKTIAAFLDSWGPGLPYFCSVRVTPLPCMGVLPPIRLLRLRQFFHSWLPFPFCVPTVLFLCGTGISTSYPSTTALALALGPDLPRADQLYSGNLRYSAGRILTFLSLLIPAFSLLSSPPLLTVWLHPAYNAPLPMYYYIPQLRCRVLAPDIFGAGSLD